MVKKLFKKYDYDISLDEGAGTYVITWVTGLMVFFVTLTIACNLGLSSISKNWVSSLSGTLTVELRPPINTLDSEKIYELNKKKFQNEIKQVMLKLRHSKDVNQARLLADSEVRKLIEPWMGNNSALDTIPLPALIDVKLNPNADINSLEISLKEIDPAVSIDSHKEIMEDVNKIIATASTFIFFLTLVISFLAIITIAGIVRSKFTIHMFEVETLHLIGANDEYIAKQFRHHSLKNTLKGAIAGLISTFAVLIIIGALTHTLNMDIFSYFKIMPMQWLMLILAPVILGSMIAHLTAQATVLRELSKLP